MKNENSSVNKFVALYLFHQLKDKDFNLKQIFPKSIPQTEYDRVCSCPSLLFTNCDDSIHKKIFNKISKQIKLNEEQFLFTEIDCTYGFEYVQENYLKHKAYCRYYIGNYIVFNHTPDDSLIQNFLSFIISDHTAKYVQIGYQADIHIQHKLSSHFMSQVIPMEYHIPRKKEYGAYSDDRFLLPQLI